MQSEKIWMAVSKHWCKLKVYTNKHEDLNLMFANHTEEDKIYPLTTIEIATAQKKDHKIYKKHAKASKEDLHFQLIEDTIVLYKDEN
jgi:hypothetical protein